MTNNINHFVFENNRYAVFVDTTMKPDEDFLVYKVSNKETGVVEVETTMLPEALNYAKGLDSAVDTFFSSLKSSEAESDIVATIAPQQIVH